MRVNITPPKVEECHICNHGLEMTACAAPIFPKAIEGNGKDSNCNARNCRDLGKAQRNLMQKNAFRAGSKERLKEENRGEKLVKIEYEIQIHVLGVYKMNFNSNPALDFRSGFNEISFY